MRVFRTGTALMLLLLLAGPVSGVGAALGRDAKRAERIRGDDDPILMPSSAMPRFLSSDALDVTTFDPDTTGSVDRPARRSPHRCNTLAWYPDRWAKQEYREAC